MTSLTVAEVLARAADLIEPEGAWTQGVFGKPGCQCVLGAIARASGVSPHSHNWADDLTAGAHALLREAIGDQWPGSALWADVWNDATERTQAEVVAKLREAAALARSSEQKS